MKLFSCWAIGLVCCLFLTVTLPAKATCDLCSIYVAQQQRSFEAGTVTAGISEQFTSFEKLQLDGNKISNPVNQFLKSSTTQIFGRYDFSKEFAVQTNIPIISRSYRQPTDEGGSERGRVSGIGDVSLLALYSPLHYEKEGRFFRLTLQGGLKLPTGDASRLAEESSPTHHGTSESETHGESTDDDHLEEKEDSHDQSVLRSGAQSELPNGIHPHSLSLGSGSWDIVTGTNFFWQIDRWIVAGNLQYLFRTEGSHNYRFADDFLWDIGFGSYLFIEEQSTVAVRLNLLGEVKGFDSVNGVTGRDTGLTSMFAGPEINMTLGSSFFALAALDLPIFVDNTGTALAPDYRVRFAVMYRF